MGLLGRFRNDFNSSGTDSLIESVIKNLSHVLNTRRDYGSFLSDFGIDDLSHCSSRDALIELLTDRVRTCIERYEPRVEILDINAEPDESPMRVSMVLSCRIIDSRTAFDLTFDTAGSRMAIGRRV